jgi:hypothetical protein
MKGRDASMLSPVVGKDGVATGLVVGNSVGKVVLLNVKELRQDGKEVMGNGIVVVVGMADDDGIVVVVGIADDGIAATGATLSRGRLAQSLGLKLRTSVSVMMGRSCASIEPKSMVVQESSRPEFADSASSMGLPSFADRVLGAGDEPGKNTEGEKESFMLAVALVDVAAAVLEGALSFEKASAKIAGVEVSSRLYWVSDNMRLIDPNEHAIGLGGQSLSPSDGGKDSGM